MKIIEADGTEVEFDYRNPEHVKIFQMWDRMFASTLPVAPIRDNETMFLLPEVEPSSENQ